MGSRQASAMGRPFAAHIEARKRTCRRGGSAASAGMIPRDDGLVEAAGFVRIQCHGHRAPDTTTSALIALAAKTLT